METEHLTKRIDIRFTRMYRLITLNTIIAWRAGEKCEWRIHDSMQEEKRKCPINQLFLLHLQLKGSR